MVDGRTTLTKSMGILLLWNLLNALLASIPISYSYDLELLSALSAALSSPMASMNALGKSYLVASRHQSLPVDRRWQKLFKRNMTLSNCTRFSEHQRNSGFLKDAGFSTEWSKTPLQRARGTTHSFLWTGNRSSQFTEYPTAEDWWLRY